MTRKPPGEQPVKPLDIRALLHRAEHSRMLIAQSSSAVVFGVAAMVVYSTRGWTVLAALAVVVTAFGVMAWLSLQVARSRFLGGAVRVSEATLPELQSVFDEVRARLNYTKQVDVYVMGKVTGGSAVTSYLGTRLILIEGGLVADLLSEVHHAELTYHCRAAVARARAGGLRRDMQASLCHRSRRLARRGRRGRLPAGSDRGPELRQVRALPGAGLTAECVRASHPRTAPR
jgi:hypothetical protein